MHRDTEPETGLMETLRPRCSCILSACPQVGAHTDPSEATKASSLCPSGHAGVAPGAAPEDGWTHHSREVVLVELPCVVGHVIQPDGGHVGRGVASTSPGTAT